MDGEQLCPHHARNTTSSDRRQDTNAVALLLMVAVSVAALILRRSTPGPRMHTSGGDGTADRDGVCSLAVATTIPTTGSPCAFIYII